VLTPVFAIAAREMTDGWRDGRAMLSAALYSLMGPGVVGLVALGVHDDRGEVLVAMMSVFTMVSAFVGGMNVAMDAIAGERERRSLLPLLMYPVTRFHLLLGKWLAVAAFSLGGLALNLAGFALVFHRMPAPAVALCLIPLSLLAAAIQLWVSTLCRGIKEAQTYLSMLVFLPMGLGMFMVFSPVARDGFWKFLPVAGQQVQLQAAMRGGALDLWRALVLGIGTAALAGLALMAAANRLEQDDVVYGG
jgi:sodium transport system permease protein